MELIKVAIADPDALLREGLKRIFSAESDLIVVGEAEHEVEAVKVVEQNKPDILLVDLNIPRREAVPLLLDLNRQNAPTRILILSLFPDKDGILNTAKAGARGYVLKRTSSTALIQAIRRIHRGEIWVDRQLSCANSFLEFARQTEDCDANRLESEILKALSKRELEILGLVAQGLTNQEISKKLFISLRTVKVHLNHIFNKLDVNNRTQAALSLVQAYQDEFAAEAAGERHKRRAVGGSFV